MNEFVKFDCACSVGYDKGVLKKTLENNIFTIFGNLNQKNSIVIRYHGALTEKESNDLTTFSIFFYFDDFKNDKKILKLQKCTKCAGDCYCATIDLDVHNTLNFGFFNENNEYELNSVEPFKLSIKPEPISDLMQRYGFEENTNLPVCDDYNDKLFSLNTILNRIKSFLYKLFQKKVC